ncbi:MAG: hypothetical protein H7A23_18590 [Leptospiraceae bacterium]|nr:hypothetical protein [Leptospiraceae bacterium]MCP5496560.1 hypothetical protein [Leptospiraceae bacterium]
MFQNPDELILLSQKVISQDITPIFHQAMRIAIYNEFKAKAFCKKIIEQFESPPPFSEILDSEIYHIDILFSLFLKYQVPTPTDGWFAQIQTFPNLTENFEVGIANEISKIEMYNDLLVHVADFPDIKDAFYKLQAVSYNHHLPTFRNALFKNLQKSDDTQERDVWQEAFESFQKGELSSETFLKLLDKIGKGQNQNLGLLLGLILSGMFSEKQEGEKYP